MPDPKTCPRCFRVVDPRASVCPHCKKRLKTSRTTWGCLVLIGLVAVGAVIDKMVNPSRTPAPPTFKTDTQTGQRYIPGPETKPAPAQDVKPLLHVREILAAGTAQIQSVLERELGAGATINFRQESDVMIWVARKGGLMLVVLPDKGRVLNVMIDFDPPARDWAAAFAMVGLDQNTPPTANPAVGPLWRGGVLSGIDEVAAFYVDSGAPRVHRLGITTDKAAWDRWTRE